MFDPTIKRFLVGPTFTRNMSDKAQAADAVHIRNRDHRKKVGIFGRISSRSTLKKKNKQRKTTCSFPTVLAICATLKTSTKRVRLYEMISYVHGVRDVDDARAEIINIIVYGGQEFDFEGEGCSLYTFGTTHIVRIPRRTVRGRQVKKHRPLTILLYRYRIDMYTNVTRGKK